MHRAMAGRAAMAPAAAAAGPAPLRGATVLARGRGGRQVARPRRMAPQLRPAASQAAWPQLPCTHRAWQARAPQPIHAQAGVQAAQAGGAGDAEPPSSSGVSGGGAAAAAAADAAEAAAALTAAAAQQLADAAAAAPLEASPAASPEPGKKGGSNFAKRVVFGVLLGLGGAAVIAYGRLPFLAATLFVVYHATQEYFGFVTSKGISQGMTPPPPFVSSFTTVLCLSITAFTYATGIKSGTAMCVAAFLLLAVNVIANRKPTFSQLTSSVFGLFYCGYLPCFWLKLRNLSVPAPPPALPALEALLPPLSVGLVATFVTVACIIAADTGAYFVGKNLGRTKLTDISPKKTVEGAAGGLASAIAAALALRSLFGWPVDAAAAAGYGALMFVSSIFGDLIESIMKREAGMKDSGNLIPGHGGLLDRFDSYMFSGAIAWFYLTTLLPRFGLA
ncbi:MAG: cytidylyltransferase family-domain-containing protein [Monoraphidium minutum]|nr:MAG: cytidylyltransferase family-domain-containing protein [Monoraphidium minutum]